RWFAERAVFGTYEGIHHELRADIRVQLQAERPDGQAMQGLLDRARQDGEAARHPVARELAALLVSELEAWAEQGNGEQPSAQPSATAGVSAAAGALFPELAESYPAAADARERVELLLDHCRARIDPRPDGYNPHDLHESAINLLSVGIKVGTDAYKSDTGARLFMKKSADLQRLLQQVP
ncbi:shikimate kinase, partial [Mesorhizobium sp. VK22B]|nr:shikimate kinase [Mesorhizobium sp. VK22B]